MPCSDASRFAKLSRTKSDVRVNPYHSRSFCQSLSVVQRTTVIAAVPCFSTVSIGPLYFVREVSNRATMSSLLPMKSRGSSVSFFGDRECRAPIRARSGTHQQGGSMPSRTSTRTAPVRRVESPFTAESGASKGAAFLLLKRRLHLSKMNAKTIGGIQYLYPSNSARRGFMLSRR